VGDPEAAEPRALALLVAHHAAEGERRGELVHRPRVRAEAAEHTAQVRAVHAFRPPVARLARNRQRRLVQGEGLTQLAEVAKSVAQVAELDSLPPPVAAL